MSGPPPYTGEKEPDYNLGTDLTVFVWTFTAISAVVLALRFFAAYHVRNRVRASDYAMFASFISMVATGALSTRACYWGLGRHIYYLSPDQITNVVKYIILMIAPGVLAVALGRISFCLFLLSAVGVTRIVRVILWTLLILQALVNVTQIILEYSSCGLHIAALWDPTIHVKCIPFKSISDYLYFLSAWNTSTDLFLTILPAYLLKDLSIEFRRKIIAIILLCLSGLAFIASLIKSVMNKELANQDTTWGFAKLNFWVLGEGYVIIVVASVPLLNSLIKRGKHSTSQQSCENSSSTKHKVTVKTSWMVEHEDPAFSSELSDQEGMRQPV